ncbi:hypothetical protein RRG08_030124 [Elysia crispata]|uniref:Uncharacterized protein n=1 Tax=Elysia crispata TaxID=231223 RepID=A0AAE0ZT16_9GAST|nr:hypothetical protein RRG08_030124 [Elysia crispata]
MKSFKNLRMETKIVHVPIIFLYGDETRGRDKQGVNSYSLGLAIASRMLLGHLYILWLLGTSIASSKEGNTLRIAHSDFFKQKKPIVTRSTFPGKAPDKRR